ncbi:MAG: MOSC N-terminal beta barrel domain-containing protein [Undibacterium sp.]|nr:MOSC N-terminal beta barrel domain-containing protein [Undibacterium sp.]
MPTITALTLYPIKSCAGMALQEAMVTDAGLSHGPVCDREWMLVDSDGQFLTQREHPKMALIRPSLAGGQLVLQAPGVAPLTLPLERRDAAHMRTVQVQVWDDILPASDEGESSARWCSDVLGIACRLVRFHPDARRVANNKWTDGQDVPTRFSDGYPLLLISEASLADLNQKLLANGQSAVPMNRFRPNIVIDGVEAFEEDYAESLNTDCGGTKAEMICLKPIKPCPRCPMPAVDQATAEVGFNPVDTLQSYRSNALMDGAVTFGMNVIVSQGAGQFLHVGDALELHLAF